MRPKISAVMTVYNGEEYLEESLLSIFNQTFNDFELIIVNDGSTDKTSHILNNINEKRTKVIHLNENIGVGGAICKALEYVSGEYIAKVDADDVYLPTRFEKQAIFLDENPHISLVDSFIEYFPHNDNVAKSERFIYMKNTLEKQINSIQKTIDIAEKLFWFPCITHSSSMFRRSIINKISYDPSLKIGEDYDFFYKLNKESYSMFKLPYVLTKVRVSQGSTTVRERKASFNAIFKIKQEEINKLISSGRQMYIWGTGELGNEVFHHINNKGNNLVGFIDNDEKKIGTYFNNYYIYNKEHLNFNDVILVSSNIGRFEINNYLKSRGFNHLKDYLIIL